MAHAFDTLSYARKLREAGVPQQQAEAHADAAKEFVMAELVTKSDLALALENLKLSITVRLGVMLVAAVAALATIIKLGSFFSAASSGGLLFGTAGTDAGTEPRQNANPPVNWAFLWILRVLSWHHPRSVGTRMGPSSRIALGAAMLGWLALLAGPASAAAEIKTQGPCVAPTGFCAQIFPSTDPIPVVRSIKYDAPSAGTASVSFHGSLLCSNTAGNGNDRVVDLVSQIVNGAGVVPDVTGPGGLRHAIVLFGRAAGTTDTFNLASTRDFPIQAAGPRTFYFKMQKLRMDASTSCIIYNAAFSVLFIP